MQDLFLQHNGTAATTQSESKKPAAAGKEKEVEKLVEEPSKAKARSKSHSCERRSSGGNSNKTPKQSVEVEEQSESIQSKKDADRENRRHTLAASSASRNCFGVSRSGRKIKPPAEFWDAQNYELDKKDEPTTVLKLEWGTGRIAYIETSEKRTRRSTISHDVRRKSEAQSAKSDSRSGKRGRGRPRKLMQGPPPGDVDDDVDQFEDLSGDEEEEVADSQLEETVDEEEDEDVHSSPKSKPSRKALQRTYYGKSETEEDEDDEELGSREDERAWSKQEDDIIQRQIFQWDPKSNKYWKNIADNIPGRTADECQRRYQFIANSKKGTTVNKKSSAPTQSKKSKKDINKIEADGLGGKNTLIRKRQVRKMMEERARGHDDDFFGDDVGEEDEEPSPEKPKKFYGNKRKQDSASEMDVEDDEQEQESPNVLKPFNRDDKDGYIESLKRRKVMQKATTIKPQIKSTKIIKADLAMKRHKYPVQVASASSDDDDEDNVQQRQPQALDYYAGDSSD